MKLFSVKYCCQSKYKSHITEAKRAVGTDLVPHIVLGQSPAPQPVLLLPPPPPALPFSMVLAPGSEPASSSLGPLGPHPEVHTYSLHKIYTDLFPK